MIFAYIRVSTDKQETDNQRFELNRFANRNGFVIDGWVDETKSGTKDYKKRELYPLIMKLQKGDRIVCSEISRLGRDLLMVMGILNLCMDRGIEIWTHKDNFRLGDNIQCKVLAFAFGLSAEIERNLISQRTKEALARKRAEGVALGRPKGRKSSRVKLTGREDQIRSFLNARTPVAKIGRILGVHRLTVAKFIKEVLKGGAK
ncbi:MAG: master DNA invertase Mpi family serine-type recombinase [Kiritimatiellaeota bacterium]|nr:master DNA invertase Mpi family serine-type recombinase [Kiritimatiellota bacterium]